MNEAPVTNYRLEVYMAVAIGVLFSLNALGSCVLVGFTNASWEDMGTAKRVLLFVGIFTNWTGLVMAYLSRNVARLIAGKLPSINGGGFETQVLTRAEVEASASQVAETNKQELTQSAQRKDEAVNTIKKSGLGVALLLLMGTALALTASKAFGQDTNLAPAEASTLWDFMTTGSNYWVAPYSTIGVSSHTVGGGLAVGYKVSEVINPVVRLDYFDGQFWMPSLTAQLQAPRKLMGKIPVIPFGIAGVATPISGAGGANGTLVTVLGAGAALRLDAFGSSKFLQHSDIVVDYEKWLGLPQKEQNQIRVGLLIKF